MEEWFWEDFEIGDYVGFVYSGSNILRYFSNLSYSVFFWCSKVMYFEYSVEASAKRLEKKTFVYSF